MGRKLLRALPQLVFWTLMAWFAIWIVYPWAASILADIEAQPAATALDSWSAAHPIAWLAIIVGIVMILGLIIEIGRFLWSAIGIPDAIGRIEGKVDSIAKDLAELKKK